MFQRLKTTFLKSMRDENGMGVVEIVLIILVLVGLAFLFKNEITSIATGIFQSIKTQVKKF